MSTPNFRTQSNFDLWLFDDTEMDWLEANEFFACLKEELDEQNDGLTFFRIELKSGYYGGVQFFVEVSRYADNAGFTEDGSEYADNESCRDYLDMCRSKAVRKYDAEIRKVNRLMKKIGEAWGFEKYFCACIFSNGEAIYRKAVS